jgi:nitroreductase
MDVFPNQLMKKISKMSETPYSQTILSEQGSPEGCDRIPAKNPSIETLDLLLRRRSLTVKDMMEPGPDQTQITQILTIGARVPDHKKQIPWRFLVIQNDARAKLGKTIRSSFLKNCPSADKAIADFEENRFLRAPLIIAVISTATASNPKVPEWEMILSAGAACQNILLAANAMGFAGQWLTEWYAYDRQVLSALNIAEHERIAGFIYIGSAAKDPLERERPDISKITQTWDQ